MLILRRIVSFLQPHINRLLSLLYRCQVHYGQRRPDAQSYLRRVILRVVRLGYGSHGSFNSPRNVAISSSSQHKDVKGIVFPILVYERAEGRGSPYIIQGFNATAWGRSKLNNEGCVASRNAMASRCGTVGPRTAWNKDLQPASQVDDPGEHRPATRAGRVFTWRPPLHAGSACLSADHAQSPTRCPPLCERWLPGQRRRAWTV